MAVDDCRRGTLWKRGSSGRLRRLSLRTTAAALVAEQNGRIRRGGGNAGSPPFPPGALAAGAAADHGGRPAPVDYGGLRGCYRRSGGAPGGGKFVRCHPPAVFAAAPCYAALGIPL